MVLKVTFEHPGIDLQHSFGDRIEGAIMSVKEKHGSIVAPFRSSDRQDDDASICIGLDRRSEMRGILFREASREGEVEEEYNCARNRCLIRQLTTVVLIESS